MHLEFNSNPALKYCLDGIDLETLEQEKDLGVVTHKSLLWSENIKSSISKANRMICWIVRNMITRERNVMLTIYKSLIRPHLEYCVQLWNPAVAHGNWQIILELEAVQRRFTRLIKDISTLPYNDRLEILKLTTLAERRLRGDLIETFKIVNNIAEYGENIYKISRSGSNIVSNVSLNISNTKVKNLRKSFLPERFLPYWNALPIFVKNSFSVNNFKMNLDIFKNDCISSGIADNCHHWSVSNEVIGKIEGANYLDNKKKHNDYLWFHPYVAKKQFVNLN